MGDKSPRQHTSKKTGRSLKEKRAVKRAKEEARTHVEGHVEIVPRGRKQ